MLWRPPLSCDADHKIHVCQRRILRSWQRICGCWSRGNLSKDSAVPAPTNPAWPAKIEQRDATVAIRQPLRCVGQLCLPIPAIPAQVNMNAADWNFQDGTNVTEHPLQMWPGAWSLNLRSRWQFVISTASPVLTQGWSIKMSGAIGGSLHGPWELDAIEIQRPRVTPPARCWMYFQKAGDDLSGRGQYYLWRSHRASLSSYTIGGCDESIPDYRDGCCFSLVRQRRDVGC
jgi:hypothetical protein